jgi:hypothetical protein
VLATVSGFAGAIAIAGTSGDVDRDFVVDSAAERSKIRVGAKSSSLIHPPQKILTTLTERKIMALVRNKR